EANVFTGTNSRDIYPLLVPPYTAIGADVTHFETIGVLKGRNFRRQCTWRGYIERSRGLLIECFVRAFEVKFMAEAIEFALLSAAGVSWGYGRFGFEGSM